MFERPQMPEDRPDNSKDAKEGNDRASSPEKISGVESFIAAGILAYRLKNFLDSKGPAVERVFAEAKSDMKSNPSALREVFANSLASFGALVMEHQREVKEQKLTVGQKFLKNLQRMAAERQQLDLLEGYGNIQDEAAAKTVKEGIFGPKAAPSAEEREVFTSPMDAAQKKKNEAAKKRVDDFVAGLKRFLE